MLNEIKYLDDLVVGKYYATVWKSAKFKSKEVWLAYDRVIKIDMSTPSGEMVQVDSGRRKFSSLRWFGPFPSNINEIDQ